MHHIKKPSSTPKEGEGPLMTKLRSRGILRSLAGFLGPRAQSRSVVRGCSIRPKVRYDAQEIEIKIEIKSRKS